MSKFKEFCNKLNNRYIIAAICVILAAVIVLGLMISLVSRPFATNTTYSASVMTDYRGVVKEKLVLLDDGRYSVTIKYSRTKEKMTVFGDYAYGKLITEEGGRRHNVMWFDGNLYDDVLNQNLVELKGPFKLTYANVTFTNVGGIMLLVFYCLLIAVLAAIATILIVKRKDGTAAFTSKMRLIKRLVTIEEMLGINHDA